VYCAAQLRDFAQHSKDFEALNTRVVAISVDGREHARQVWEKPVSRQFTVLSDPGARVIRTYGVLHPAAGDMGQDIARDATLLVDVDGRERWRRVSQTITDHARAEEVLARIRRLAPSTKPATQDGR
jgi:peroxiredoxin